MFSGIRPGEKLSEDLFESEHAYGTTRHPDIFRLDTQCDNLKGEPLITMVDELVRLARECDGKAIIALLDDLIPCAAIRSTPPPSEIESIDG